MRGIRERWREWGGRIHDVLTDALLVDIRTGALVNTVRASFL